MLSRAFDFNIFIIFSFFVLYSIEHVLSQIDVCIQYGEDADVKVKDFDPEDD